MSYPSVHPSFCETKQVQQDPFGIIIGKKLYTARQLGLLYSTRVAASLRLRSRTRPSTGNINPLGQAAALLAFDVHNVRVAAAAAAHTVLLGCVPLLPVLVLLNTLALIGGGLLKPGLTRQLARGGVGGAVLNRGVAVAKVAEVMDIARGEESTGGKGVDGCITPLCSKVSTTG